MNFNQEYQRDQSENKKHWQSFKHNDKAGVEDFKIKKEK